MNVTPLVIDILYQSTVILYYYLRKTVFVPYVLRIDHN